MLWVAVCGALGALTLSVIANMFLSIPLWGSIVLSVFACAFGGVALSLREGIVRKASPGIWSTWSATFLSLIVLSTGVTPYIQLWKTDIGLGRGLCLIWCGLVAVMLIWAVSAGGDDKK